MSPRIAVTTGLSDLDGKRQCHLPVAYADAVRAAGGEPILLCPPRQSEPLPPLEHLADGLLLTGGDDLDPAAWGQSLHPEARPIDSRRQRADLALAASSTCRTSRATTSTTVAEAGPGCTPSTWRPGRCWRGSWGPSLCFAAKRCFAE